MRCAAVGTSQTVRQSVSQHLRQRAQRDLGLGGTVRDTSTPAAQEYSHNLTTLSRARPSGDRGGLVLGLNMNEKL